MAAETAGAGTGVGASTTTDATGTEHEAGAGNGEAIGIPAETMDPTGARTQDARLSGTAEPTGER